MSAGGYHMIRRLVNLQFIREWHWKVDRVLPNHSQPVAASQGTSNIPGFYSHNVTARHGKEREIAWRVETCVGRGS